MRPGDEPGLLQLLQAAFDGWPKVPVAVSPLEHLRWKLSSHPNAYRYAIVAEAEGQLIAIRQFFIERIKARDRVWLLRNGFDSAVHPDWQARGVMGAIRTFRVDRFTDEIDLHIGYGNNPAVLKLRKREEIRYFSNPVDVLTLDLPASFPASPPVWQIAGAGRFDERFDSFYAEASQQFDLIIERSVQYLNWRYADPRAGVFHIRIAEEEGCVLGYAVLNVANGRASIADLLALPGRIDVAASLVDDAIGYAIESGATTLECWCQTRHPYKDVLLARSFRPKRTIRLTYLPLRTARAEVEFLASPKAAVHFALGDTDLV